MTASPARPIPDLQAQGDGENDAGQDEAVRGNDQWKHRALAQEVTPAGLVDDPVMRPEAQQQENGDLRGLPLHERLR
jgi:hypothetical protein